MGLQLPKRARRVTVGALTAAAVLFLSGCSAEDKDQIKRLAMPISASKEAPHIDGLWKGAWLAAILTGLVVWGLIAFVSVRYRRRSEDEVPVQTRYNLPIEILYTIAPVMMVIVFFFFTIREQDASLHDWKNPDHDVTVVGQQWSWTFNYVKEDAVGGKTVYDPGTPADPPTLWLVDDDTVEFHLFSPDVAHSFWVPVFLFKMDVIPGRDNHFGVKPDRKGTFQGKCAELCGVYHSRMRFDVKIVDQDEYDAHLKKLQAAGYVGLNKGSSQVEDEAGLESNGGKE